MRKLNINFIKDEMKIKNPNIKILDTEYINAKSKLKCECLLDGEIFYAAWSTISKGHGCPKCGGSKPLTIDIVKLKVKEINPNIEILSTEYINAKSKLKCQCLIDGTIWESSWGNLSQGCGCLICARETTLLKRTTPFIEMKNKIKEINSNIEAMYEYYKYLGDDLHKTRFFHCRCLVDNNEWDTSLSHLLDGKGCRECANRRLSEERSFSLDEIKLLVKLSNPNIEILSPEYKNARTRLKCFCKIDNHTWETSWASLQKCGCPQCGINRRKGELNSNWKGGISVLNDYIRTIILPWKKDSFKQCNYKCAITGSTKNKIIHHLYGFDKIITETMEILNLPVYQEINQYSDEQLKSIEDLCLKLHNKYGLGVCLCEEEHKLFHSIYGYGNNTPEQFEEFRELRLKQLKSENQEVAS